MSFKLLTTSLDIDSISSERNREEFNELELETLARAIIASGGIINPILVREISPIKYEVIEGHFEFYAAVKASEIDFKFAEIRAIVFPKDSQLDENIINQIKILRKKETSSIVRLTDNSIHFQKHFNNLEQFLLNQFSILESKINPPQSQVIDLSAFQELLRQQEERIVKQVQPYGENSSEFFSSELSNTLQKQITTLEVVYEDNVKTLRQIKIELQNANKKPIDRIDQLIEDLNNLDKEALKKKMIQCNLKQDINQIISLIIDRRQQSKFINLQDIRKIKSKNGKTQAITDVTIILLLENWIG